MKNCTLTLMNVDSNPSFIAASGIENHRYISTNSNVQNLISVTATLKDIWPKPINKQTYYPNKKGTWRKSKLCKEALPLNQLSL
jgi:hypothetical protein